MKTTIVGKLLKFETSSPIQGATPGHGDWVLKAFQDNLEQPEQTEIICINLPTLNGPESAYSALFSPTSTNWYDDGETDVSILENIILEWINDPIRNLYSPNSERLDYEYELSCVSVSIAGAYTTTEEPTFEFEKYYAPIIQSAPNVNKGDYDWGSNYPSVVNVGAWNKALDNEFWYRAIKHFQQLMFSQTVMFPSRMGRNIWHIFLDKFGILRDTKVAADADNLHNDVLYRKNNDILFSISKLMKPVIHIFI